MPTKKTGDEPDTPVGVTADTFDLLDWIESGTVGRRDVVIYNDPALIGEYEKVQARLDDLGYDETSEQREERTKDASLADGEAEEIQTLLDQMGELYERWQASKATWTVRAISREEVQESFDQHPDPKTPVPPGDKAAKAERDEFVDALNVYSKDKAVAEAERQLVQLSICVVRIVTPKGETDHASVDQLRALRSRPHGEQWVTRLYEAMAAATEADVEIPRPTSNGRSASSQG